MNINLIILNFTENLGKLFSLNFFLLLFFASLLYIPIKKFIQSKFLSVVISLLSALLIVRIIPKTFFSIISFNVLVIFILLSVFIIFLFFRFVWWFRQVIFLLFLIAFLFLWSKQNDVLFLTLFFITFLFLLIDIPLHKKLERFRRKGEKRKKLKAEIALLEEKVEELIKLGKKEEAKTLEKELDKKINLLNKL